MILGAGGYNQAPYAWLPGEPSELIFGTFASLVIFAALWKFALPAIKKSLAERSAKIQATMDSAAATKARAEADAAAARANLGNAEAEAAEIVATARRQAAEIESSAAARLEAEVVDVRAKAMADIESLKSRSSSDLQGSVAALAIGAAEKVVDKNLDDDTQQSLIEQFIAQVGAMHV
jgi:F-type H+-transporting ATPase subunit b